MLWWSWRGSPLLPQQAGRAGEEPGAGRAVAGWGWGGSGRGRRCPSPSWGAGTGGSKRGLAAEGGRAGLQGLAPASSDLLRGRGTVCRAGEPEGTGTAWEHGRCCPRGVPGLPGTWVFPTFLPGFISWGLASFPAQEEHIQKTLS